MDKNDFLSCACMYECTSTPLVSVLAYISLSVGEGDLKNVVSLTFRIPT